MLEPEQEQLLCQLVEAARNVPRDQREKFLLMEQTAQSSYPVYSAHICHPGLPDRSIEWYTGDIDILADGGFLILSRESHGISTFDVTPKGFAHYRQLKSGALKPTQQLEADIRGYLDAEAFRRNHPRAYHKWTEAQEKLWSGESEHQLTVIGHLCREAMQEFASGLVDRYGIVGTDKNKSHVVARLRVAMGQQRDKLGRTTAVLLDALLAYWQALNDLVQRQEHAGQKEGQPLVWEDGRRVVFQTAAVMFEIDRALR